MPWWHHNCQVSIWSHGQWMVQKCQELHIITLYLQISKCPTTKGRYGAGRASEKKKTSALCTLSMLEVLSLISQNRGCTNGTITLLILGHSANWSDIGGHWKNIWHLRPNILQTALKKLSQVGPKSQILLFLSSFFEGASSLFLWFLWLHLYPFILIIYFLPHSLTSRNV